MSYLNDYSPLYVSSSGDPSDTMAAITRQQYNDWLNRFSGTEERLLELAQNNELNDAQIERNQEGAALNLEQANASAANAQAKYGLADQRTSTQKNNLELTNALSLASANNESRAAIGDLQRNIIAGTSGSVTSQINEI